MKYNKWTTALAAAGVVSLGVAAQAEESQNPVMTAVSATTLSGYVDTSAIWQFGNQVTHDGRANNLPGRSYDGADKQDGFNLNVVKLSLEKPLDDANWSAGYKAELLFGPDANTYATQSTLAAGTSDFAIKQAYVALRAPLGNGLDLKMGVFDTIIGYEVFESGNNPTYSRSYGYFMEPLTHTGLLGSYQVAEWLKVAGGIANTQDSTINGRAYSFNGPAPVAGVGNPYPRTSSEFTYMGSVALTAPESMGSLKGATLYGGVVEGQPSNGNYADIQNYYGGLTVPTPLTGLSVGAAYDYRGVAAKSPAFSLQYANAVSGYLVYKATEKLTLASRSEYTSANNGFYYIHTTDSGNQIFAETVTVDYKLWAPVITRLEFRWDRCLTGGAQPFGVEDQNAFSLALNVIYKF